MNRCSAKTKTGSPCKNRVQDEDLCNIHLRAKHGQPHIAQLRRVRNNKPVTKLLTIFGLPPREVRRLMAVYPNLSQVNSQNLTPEKMDALLDDLIGVLTVRLVAQPAPDIADTLSTIVSLRRQLATPQEQQAAKNAMVESDTKPQAEGPSGFDVLRGPGGA